MKKDTETAIRFDESIRTVLAAGHPEEEKRELLSALGLAPTILSAVTLGIALKAAAGDVSAAKFLRDICVSGEGREDATLAPFTEEELRALLQSLEEDTHDTRNAT